MMKNVIAVLVLVIVLGVLVGCDEQSNNNKPRSASGVKEVTATVRAGSDGLTTEQRNIRDRLTEDNKPGSIKHLYVISAYSGQVIIYSTVRGKVTSGGKRLTPTTVSTSNPNNSASDGIPVQIGGKNLRTGEVLQDDGTYGVSGDYLYWWDTKGVYHQHYVSGGQIVHVSNQPLAVKGIIINMELTVKEKE